MKDKKVKKILCIVIPVLAIVIILGVFLYNPSFGMNISGKTVIYTENVEFEETSYTVYVTDKSGELGINAYTGDGFLSSPREVGLGSGDEGQAHYILVVTGVKNEEPFTEAIHIYAVRSGVSAEPDGSIIKSTDFEYSGSNYSIIYAK